MSTLESAVLLFLVVDPFGNLPFVLAVLSSCSAPEYRRAVTRETLLGSLVLVVFALAGDQILGYLSIEGASLAVAGGVILFLISLKMIFKSSAHIFDDSYRDNPLLVPIAVPSLAGPSAITAVMILRTQQQLAIELMLAAVVAVMLATWIILLAGRPLSVWLGPRGISAMEKFMGLLLNLVAVNMMLRGIREFLLT
ncbi:MAG: MarC family protein [Gammaproteobacteria bacterium]|jgi:multiple antibiotic resistance protein